MAILSLHGINLSYGTQLILKNISFKAEEGDIIGLVGDNGAGKTTIFRLIVGEIVPDGGSIFLKKETSIGYLPQEPDFYQGRTVYQEVLTVFEEVMAAERQMARLSELMGESGSEDHAQIMRAYSRLQETIELKGGYTYKNRIEQVLSGLGFSVADWERETSSLSGGEKSIVGLAKILLAEPDLLLLDEPANHLDIAATEWLEDYLSAYRGTVVVISHNRYLLDRLTDAIVDLEDGATHTYPGNYSNYSLAKKLRLAKMAENYQLQQREINRLEKMIERLRGKGVKGIRQSKNKAKGLSKIERMEKPVSERKGIKFDLGGAPRSGGRVLGLENLTMTYDDRCLFSDLNLHLSLGDRVGVIGPNGSGKSTLFRLILGQERANSGEIEYGVKVKVGYYSQEHETLDPESTPFTEILGIKPVEDWKVYALLGRFLFSREDADRKIKALSGGEKSRLQIAKMMFSGANLLLLDEPTNHLDIKSCEVLESALGDFPGTIISISHDRYFLDKIVDKILEIEDGGTTLYHGDFTYYQEKKVEKKLASLSKENGKKRTKVGVSHPKPRSGPKEESIEDLEAKIYVLEDEKGALERELEEKTALKEFPKLGELSRRLDQVTEELKDEYQRWEESAAKKVEEGAESF